MAAEQHSPVSDSSESHPPLQTRTLTGASSNMKHARRQGRTTPQTQTGTVSCFPSRSLPLLSFAPQGRIRSMAVVIDVAFSVPPAAAAGQAGWRAGLRGRVVCRRTTCGGRVPVAVTVLCRLSGRPCHMAIIHARTRAVRRHVSRQGGRRRLEGVSHLFYFELGWFLFLSGLLMIYRAGLVGSPMRMCTAKGYSRRWVFVGQEHARPKPTLGM